MTIQKSRVFHKKFRFLVYFSTYCVLISVFIIGCARRQIANIDSQGKNIICFGDSITAGYGADPGEDYPAQLAKMVNMQVINAGITADTSQDALKRIESDILDKNPLLVIVEFGGNDFMKKIPLEETLKNTEEIIIRIQAGGAIVAVADVSNNMIMGNYRKEFKRLSKKYNTIFIPKLFTGILTNPSLKSDFIHPNAQGYKLIAQRIYLAIAPYLRQNFTLKKY